MYVCMCIAYNNIIVHVLSVNLDCIVSTVQEGFNGTVNDFHMYVHVQYTCI